MDDSGPKKVAVACQGGGMHAAFAVGVLTEILTDYEKGKFELVGLSGTSAGALCALMAWYGLAPKRNGSRSVSNSPMTDAIHKLNQFWDDFVAASLAENALNGLTYGSFLMEEQEVPLLGLNTPIPGINPYGLFYKAVAASLPYLGVRNQYFDMDDMLKKACPEFDNIDWKRVKTRLLIGASEVVHGLETVFDSNVNKGTQPENPGMQSGDTVSYWRQQLPLCLAGIAASGTLPTMREAEHINGRGYYWDGLYSQNPPVREFFPIIIEKSKKKTTEEWPTDLWIVRINPQQWPYPPTTQGDIQDRQNELMGNLSLSKELDFILQVMEWKKLYEGTFVDDYGKVTVRTIKMDKKIADDLQYSSKFDRSHEFMDWLRRHGKKVARAWLDRGDDVGTYPADAGY
jgi:NTE family protein